MSVTTTQARARKTDPETSHEAATSVRDVRRSYQYVIRALRRPAHDVVLIERYRKFATAPRATDSGIRTRRKELVRLGMIVDTGRKVKLDSGRQSIVWALNTEHLDVQRILGKA